MLEEVQVVGEACGRGWMSFAHPRHLCRIVPFVLDSDVNANASSCVNCW